MEQEFEYKFVRLGEGWLAVKKHARSGYQDEITKYASQGWRLVQIFAPAVGSGGVAGYFELVLERPVKK